MERDFQMRTSIKRMSLKRKSVQSQPILNTEEDLKLDDLFAHEREYSVDSLGEKPLMQQQINYEEQSQLSEDQILSSMIKKIEKNSTDLLKNQGDTEIE